MNSFLTHLECSVCGTRHDPNIIQTTCNQCGKILFARYHLERVRDEVDKAALKKLPPTMWKHASLLPILHAANIQSLGEQITPIIKLEKLGRSLGLTHVWVKDEGQLPTGSFKSRGLAMAVSKAKELGVTAICIPSAGNAAGASAAYAAKAGIECWIFIPEDTPSINIKECRAYGAHVELVKGNISDAAKRMNEVRQQHPEWFDVSTLKEPYRLEGKKTMGFELAEQFEWELPDVILYPTGGGTGLIGMWKAFDEMQAVGWIGSKRPRMISVQSNGCAPIVKAFHQKKTVSEFWNDAQTVASGLRVPKPFADYLILQIIRDSCGEAVAVKDQEIPPAVHDVAKQEGLLFSPEGVAPVPALRQLIDEKKVGSDERILLFNTATGLKYPEIL